MERGSSTARHALTVLEAVIAQPGTSLTDVAARTGSTINRTFRMLATLEAAGYVERDASKTYRPGAMVLFGGLVARHDDPLVSVAEPHLRRLAGETEQVVTIAKRVDLDRVVITAEIPASWNRSSGHRGDRTPAYWGALGYGVLAFAPDDVLGRLQHVPLKPVHGTREVDRQDLLQALDTVRRTRVWMTRDTSIGLFSVASPIVTTRMGEASIGIAGALKRLDDMDAERLKDLVREAALGIGASLG